MTFAAKDERKQVHKMDEVKYESSLPGRKHDDELVTIKIKISGSGSVNGKTISRAEVGQFSVGSVWTAVDKATTFTVVTH